MVRSHYVHVWARSKSKSDCPASQVEESYLHDGSGPVEGITTSSGKWNTYGHRDRVVKIDLSALAVIHSLSEEHSVPVTEARFIQPFSARTLDVFHQMAQHPKLDAAIPKIERIITTATGDRTAEIPLWQMSRLWDETNSQKEGTIRRQTAFRPIEQMILQGPLFHAGNPLNKTPRAYCGSNKAYDVVDLVSAPDDYLPRTNYGPAVEMEEYLRRMTACRWNPTVSHVDFYRVAFRSMIPLNGERSLISALIPPHVAHIHKVESLACENPIHTLEINSLAVSLPYDFLIKANGRGDLFSSDIARWPYPAIPETAVHRALRLVCLTSAYAPLWNAQIGKFDIQPWSSSDPRLAIEGPIEGPANWDRTAGLRTEFARRMAMVEIDVLIAQALDLSLDQLAEIYQVYFPTMRKYEVATWYDQRGRIVWTSNSNGLPNIGYLEHGRSPGRAAWERILADNPAELTCTAIDDTMPGGPRTVTRHFIGPFTQCDRIEDYRRAWAHFERHRANEAAE